MTRFKLACIAFSVAVLAGCANGPSAQGPCADPASTDPSCARSNPSQKGGANQAAAEAKAEAESVARFEALQQQLNEETSSAETSIAGAVDATKTLPKAQRARNSAVQTKTAEVTDSETPRTSEMTMLDTVTIELPLAGKSKRGYTNAMNAVKALAGRIADSRGSATIQVEQATADVRARKVNISEGESKTKDGNTLIVKKVSTTEVPRGVERYTIQAGDLQKRP